MAEKSKPKTEEKDDTDKYLHKLEKKITGKLKKTGKNKKSLKRLLECLREERKKTQGSEQEDSLDGGGTETVKITGINAKEGKQRIQLINSLIAKSEEGLNKKEKRAKKKGKEFKETKTTGTSQEDDVELIDEEPEITSRQKQDEKRLHDSAQRIRMFESWARDSGKAETGAGSSTTAAAPLRRARTPPDLGGAVTEAAPDVARRREGERGRGRGYMGRNMGRGHNRARGSNRERTMDRRHMDMGGERMSERDRSSWYSGEMDMINCREATDMRELRDTGNTRDAWDARDFGDINDAQDTRDFRGMRDVRDVRDMRDIRDMRDMRDMRCMRDMRDMRDMQDTRNMLGVRDLRDTRDVRDVRDMRDVRGVRNMRDMRDFRDMQQTRNDRELSDLRDRRNMREARDMEREEREREQSRYEDRLYTYTDRDAVGEYVSSYTEEMRRLEEGERAGRGRGAPPREDWQEGRRGSRHWQYEEEEGEEDEGMSEDDEDFLTTGCRRAQQM